MKDFLRQFFMADNGQASIARILMVLIIVLYLVGAIILTIQSKKIPDIPPVLASLVGLLYGANKLLTKVG